MSADRGVAEYSDDDEEAEFSSAEDNDEQLYDANVSRTSVSQTRKGLAYRKLQHGAHTGDDAAMGAHAVDSDSEFEHSRKGAKLPSSRVKIKDYFHVYIYMRARIYL